MGERPVSFLGASPSRAKACCETLSHQCPGLAPLWADYMSYYKESRSCALSNASFSCCYCFCLSTQSKSSPGILAIQGGQGLGGTRTRPAAPPLPHRTGLHSAAPMGGVWGGGVDQRLAWFLSAHVSCGQGAIVPRGPVCVSLWEQ